MANWIKPLELGKIFSDVFAGDPRILMAIAIITISGMAAYFRMTFTTLIFFIMLFSLMFVESVSGEIWYMIVIIGGLVVGFVLSKIISR